MNLYTLFLHLYRETEEDTGGRQMIVQTKDQPPQPSLIPVAQYLRMSTDQQQYSLEHQAFAIAKYAKRNGFQVTRTYCDAARSGVVLHRRTGLRQLLEEVVSGRSKYKAILVYDVSRWGRFQDTDESAHYEFLCKCAGVPVHYCADIFGSISKKRNPNWFERKRLHSRR